MAAAELLARHYSRTNSRLLGAVEELDDDQVRRSPGPGAHSVAFNLWHVARWADHLAANVPRMTPVLADRLGPGRQIWEAEELADRWGFPAEALGVHETGMLMADDAAAGLPLPDKAVLLGYARRALAAADRAVAAIDDQLLEPNALERAADPASPATVGDAVVTHLEHNNRHLGEMECLRGLLGLRGTATR